MSNTQLVLTLPERRAGLSLTTGSVGWVYTGWKAFTEKTNCDILVTGLTLQITKLSVDVTYEFIFDIGIGNAGYEITKIQIPYTHRSDTAVGYYMDASIMLPEPYFIPAGTRIAIKMAQQNAFGDTYNGIKLKYTADTKLVDTTQQDIPNNYKFTTAGNGMSVTEKIR